MSSDLGANEVALGTYGTIKGIGMVLGAILMSVVTSRWGLKPAGILTLLLVCAGGVTLSFITDPGLILMLGLGLGVIAGLQWTVYATIAMGITDLRIAGSMFALFQMMANIGIASGEGVATSLSDNIGFSGVFLMLGVVSILLVPLFLLVTRKLNLQRG
jgi:predicted MFS family arabinose efflux permease